ncbi:alanine:cation symporter family protein [Glutamicibacter sp. MNS18]|uniref:alanine/glycine:cation symporter family protein n=1 Tax=Glutamicibacter sp. MNS18 TaxID=2989817 RepID=UPI0022361100|nr:alanine/glycine:cation symporter family protein [Glutamicibacter sp. MNS18]MCW4466784.1 alanine:cation symporter family protein [Glutamicibacter sp. MNS18]
MEAILSNVSSAVWAPLAYVILGLGAVFTVALLGVQFRRFPDMLRQIAKGGSGEGGLSSFQALALTLSARVGVGAIAGVATAIAAGGPGAMMWMVITALLASTVAYAEAVLAQVFKQRVRGEQRGGMPFYIKYGLKAPRFAMVVALISMVGYGFIFPGIQVNNIASSAELAFGMETWVTGLLVTTLLGIVIIGGTKRIVRVSQAVVPVMSFGFLLCAVIIIAANIVKVPEVAVLIFSSAFGTHAVFGGLIGYAVQWGVRRAVFASAAGDGEGTYAAGAAQNTHPGKQGLVQAFSIYVTVLLICTATGMMILLAGTYNVDDGQGGFVVEHVPGLVAGPNFVQQAIDSVLPGAGPAFVAIAVFLFAFTSQIFYFYVASTNLLFLTENESMRRLLEVVLKVGALGISFFGSVANAKAVWAAGDLGFGLLAWANMVTLVLLAPVIIKVCRDYDRQRTLGLDPVFDPTALGIRGATFWEDREDLKSRLRG